MTIEVPTSSKDEVLQDRFNRQVAESIAVLAEAITEVNNRVDYISNIPDDGSIVAVADIVSYLRGA